MTSEQADPRHTERDETLCAGHRDGKPGEPHEWRRGRRGRTVVATCHPTTPSQPVTRPTAERDREPLHRGDDVDG